MIRILWAEGFGFIDTDRRLPITPDTIFGLESMSKIFTASGVLIAVQEGLRDLDEPILATWLVDARATLLLHYAGSRGIG